MVKYCIKKYPMGSWKGQKTPGRYMDGWLYKNLELLADKIKDDMTFLGIIYSSTLEVGTGKSVLATQIGEAWTEIVNKKYNPDIPYDVNNIVWRPKELIEKSFNVPKYTYVLLDEWEDATYWSELGISLRQFFRKCRQLNLFIMCIIPNWFQLPIPYAVSRSIFAIDVRFDDKLNRGIFAFYNFPAKRMLYINGKRQYNYRAAHPTFMGKFPDGYGVDEIEYRKRKLEDMKKYEKENPEKLDSRQKITRLKAEFLKRFKEKMPSLNNIELGEILGVTEKTIIDWKNKTVEEITAGEENYTNELIEFKKREITVDESALEKMEKEKGPYIEEDVQGEDK